MPRQKLTPSVAILAQVVISARTRGTPTPIGCLGTSSSSGRIATVTFSTQSSPFDFSILRGLTPRPQDQLCGRGHTAIILMEAYAERSWRDTSNVWWVRRSNSGLASELSEHATDWPRQYSDKTHRSPTIATTSPRLAEMDEQEAAWRTQEFTSRGCCVRRRRCQGRNSLRP